MINKVKQIVGSVYIGEKDNKSISYDKYYFTPKELLKYFLIGEVIVLLISFMFYRSFIAVLVLTPLVWFYIRRKQKELLKQRQNKLNIQFKDGIASVAGALNAGYSIENSCKEALRDMELLYGNDEIITIEFQNIVKQLEVNKTVEYLFFDLAKRSGIEDIKCFAEIFGAAKRSGGDLINIINNTAASIGQKIDLKQEIYTITASKRLEQKIMNMVPFIIILYINISSPGFLMSMYHNIPGIIIMSVCLLVYFFAFILADRIISIEI